MEASLEQDPPTNGLSADNVRSNVPPFHVTRKFENCGFVESKVNDPESGDGDPDVVVKLIVYAVTVSA